MRVLDEAGRALEEKWALEDAVEKVLEEGAHFQPEAMTFEQLMSRFPYGTHSWQEVRTSRKGNRTFFGSVTMVCQSVGGEWGSVSYSLIVAIVSPEGCVFNYCIFRDNGYNW